MDNRVRGRWFRSEKHLPDRISPARPARAHRPYRLGKYPGFVGAPAVGAAEVVRRVCHQVCRIRSRRKVVPEVWARRVCRIHSRRKAVPGVWARRVCRIRSRRKVVPGVWVRRVCRIRSYPGVRVRALADGYPAWKNDCSRSPDFCGA